MRSLSLVLLFLGALVMTESPAESGEKLWVYFGTYTSGDSKGIYRAEFDSSTGTLSDPTLAAETKNASFLALHPAGKHLYAVNEVSDTDGKPVGAVSAFSLEPATGNLTLINWSSTKGAGPCHLIVAPGGTHVLAANYGGGSAVCIPIKADGSLAEASSFVQHAGSSVNPSRQKGPHAHSINLDPDGNFAVVADLGLDQVLVYRFNPEHGTLTPNDPPYVMTPLGGGPRHFAFHPSGQFGYTNNEILLSVTAFRYDGSQGVLSPIQTISTVPDGTGLQGNSTAEIRVHPNGKFLYVSNRGPDSLAVYSIEQNTGMLTRVGIVPSGGKIPRNFNLTPDGAYLLAAHQNSDNIVVFKINAETGLPEPTGREINVPKCVCVRFLGK